MRRLFDQQKLILLLALVFQIIFDNRIISVCYNVLLAINSVSQTRHRSDRTHKGNRPKRPIAKMAPMKVENSPLKPKRPRPKRSSYGRPTWYRSTSPSVNKSAASTHATSKSKSATAAQPQSKSVQFFVVARRTTTGQQPQSKSA